jgi:enoyl-CoA hydratase
MTYETITYQKETGIGIIIFNRPGQRNAINEQMISELNRVLDEIEDDDRIRVLIITGGETVFCAGADLKEHFTPATSKRWNDLFSRIEKLAKPTIAAINGYAYGGGCELSLCCDLRVASETALIGLQEIKVGIIPSAGSAFRLPRLIGVGRAKEMQYFGEAISGRDAFTIGLVNRVVPAGTALDAARGLAEILLDRPPLSLKAIKECIHAGMQLDTESAMNFVMNAANLLRSTEDYQEGRKAFKEKRKPVWKGR